MGNLRNLRQWTALHKLAIAQGYVLKTDYMLFKLDNLWI